VNLLLQGGVTILFVTSVVSESKQAIYNCKLCRVALLASAE
jgi:hypothetical protein